MKNQQLEVLKDIEADKLTSVVQTFKRQQKQKTILLLEGPMGSGKTTFTRVLLESFGFQSVQSPTYALHNRYSLKDFDIEHLDLFRMKSALELDGIGFWDFFYVDQGLIIIEWPERMDLKSLPADWEIFKIEISLVSSTKRNFSLSKISF